MHTRESFFLLGLSIALGLTLNSKSEAQILALPNMEQLCKAAPEVTHRRTLVYVDLTSIANGRKDWGLTVLNRLELAPREWLTVLGVNPNTFEVDQVFDLCFPALTKAEIDAERHGRGLWSTLTNLDPQDQQRENLQTFDARLRNSLDKLVADAAKLKTPTRRNILGAIAFDKDRFSDRSASYRIIIYTNGEILDPDLPTGMDTSKQAAALISKYPASFFGADISVFGVSEAADASGSLQSRESVFSAFFLSNWAHLKSFSSSLPQQRNDLFPAIVRWDGNFEGGATQGAARLAFSPRNGAGSAEIWVNFVVSRLQLFVPFEGTVKCDGDHCKIAATCMDTVPLLSANPYFRKGDRLTLEGKRDLDFEGSLVAETREVFNGGGQEVKYNLQFRRP